MGKDDPPITATASQMLGPITHAPPVPPHTYLAVAAGLRGGGGGGDTIN